jgi:hypothetical protein
MANQIFRHAHVIPRIGFLKVDEAGLKDQIESRDNADGKRQQAESGYDDPLPAVQESPEC